MRAIGLFKSDDDDAAQWIESGAYAPLPVDDFENDELVFRIKPEFDTDIAQRKAWDQPDYIRVTPEVADALMLNRSPAETLASLGVSPEWRVNSVFDCKQEAVSRGFESVKGQMIKSSSPFAWSFRVFLDLAQTDPNPLRALETLVNLHLINTFFNNDHDQATLQTHMAQHVPNPKDRLAVEKSADFQVQYGSPMLSLALIGTTARECDEMFKGVTDHPLVAPYLARCKGEDHKPTQQAVSDWLWE